jgi:dihydroxyacetone kinase
VLVDQTLANDKFVRIAVVGRAGNFSSKLLSDKHITAVVTDSESSSKPSSKELAQVIDEAGHRQHAGIVILRSGKQKKLTRPEDELVEVELKDELEVDHLIHLLGAATEPTRYARDQGRARTYADRFTDHQSKRHAKFCANSSIPQPL